MFVYVYICRIPLVLASDWLSRTTWPADEREARDTRVTTGRHFVVFRRHKWIYRAMEDVSNRSFSYSIFWYTIRSEIRGILAKKGLWKFHTCNPDVVNSNVIFNLYPLYSQPFRLVQAFFGVQETLHTTYLGEYVFLAEIHIFPETHNTQGCLWLPLPLWVSEWLTREVFSRPPFPSCSFLAFLGVF